MNISALLDYIEARLGYIPDDILNLISYSADIFPIDELYEMVYAYLGSYMDDDIDYYPEIGIDKDIDYYPEIVEDDLYSF